MKTRTMALVASAMFGIALTASATPPEQDRSSSSVQGQTVGNCGDFWVLTDYYLDISYKLFFDKSGNAIRDLAVVNLDGFSKYYNSTDPDRFVEGGPHEVQVQRFDFAENTYTFMGPGWRINLPGQGVIFLTTGRLVVDWGTKEVLFQAGPQDWLEGNLDELCAALR